MTDVEIIAEFRQQINQDKDYIIKLFKKYAEQDFFNFIDNLLSKNDFKAYTFDIFFLLNDFESSKSFINFLKSIGKYYGIDINRFEYSYVVDDAIKRFLAPEYTNIIHEKVKKHLNTTNILTINKHNVIVLKKSSTEKIVMSLYKEMKSYIRNNIKTLFPNIMKHYYFENDNIIDTLENINWQTLQNMKLMSLDKELLIRETLKRYKPELNEYIKKYTELHVSEPNINVILFPKLTEYINKNLKSIFLTFELEKDYYDSKAYRQSWIDNDGLLSGFEFEYLFNYLIENKNEILKKLNLSNFITKISESEYADIIDEYLTKYAPQLEYKIHNLISLKNDAVRQTRSKDLLKLKDNIKEKTHIDYDPTDDHIRTRPIVIIKSTTGEDIVMFGPKGSSHGNYVSQYLFDELERKHIDYDPTYMGYGYLLGRIAFVDEQGDAMQVGYSLDDEVNILINDPRIEKIYQTASHPMPGGGLVTRLAKLIKKR